MYLTLQWNHHHAPDGTHRNWRRISKKQDDWVEGLMLCYVMLELLTLSPNKITWWPFLHKLFTIPTSICKQHPNFRRNFHSLGYTRVVYDDMLELLTLSRIEAMPSAFWSAESEALNSAEHYGPLKTRLHHSAKHCGPLKVRLKTMAKSQIFLPFFYI